MLLKAQSDGVSRRTCLSTSVAALLGVCLGASGRATGAVTSGAPVILPEEHRRAVWERKRRIVVQHDAHDVLSRYAKRRGNEAPFAVFCDAVFAYVDDPLTEIDAVWLDVAGITAGAVYPSKVLPPVELPLLKYWLGQGTDWIAELVRGARERKREIFWNHRISDVDGKAEGGLEMEHLHPLKAAHPDWVVPASFWWQGMWNLAAPGLREHKVSVLRELVTNYDFDGIQIDFSRHIPCLPVGRQWELRGEVTEFMRMIRVMCLEAAAGRGRSILVAAKIPQTLAGCRMDGFDVAEWARQGLVDILTLGSRSIEVDTDDFRRVVGEQVQLQPCFDDHHATDGYRHAPLEVLRGVFANHWQRGADSVVTFNWATGPAELCREIGCEEGPESQRDAYREIGDPVRMRGRDKIFALDRKGGYPWADGFFNRNDTASLPAPLGDQSATFAVHLRDAPSPGASCRIRLVLWGAGENDAWEVRLNDTPLTVATRDAEWKDAQIFRPKPQPASGGAGQYRINPQQRLLRVDFAALVWKEGANTLTIRRLANSLPPDALVAEVFLEKLEAHLRYN